MVQVKSHMKLVLFFLLFVASKPLCAQPTADEFESFLGFDEKCPVSVHDVEPKKNGPLGDMVWLKAYVPERSLYHYLIGVSKKGTLFGERRTGVEQGIRQRPNDLRRMSSESFLYKEVIKTDLGEEFFTIDAISKDGTSMVGFTTVGDYDVFVVEYATALPQWNKANPGKSPLTPKNRLPDVLNFIAGQVATHPEQK